MKKTKHTPAIKALNDLRLSNSGETFTLGGGKYTRQVWLDQHIPTIIQTLEIHDELLEALENLVSAMEVQFDGSGNRPTLNKNAQEYISAKKSIAKARGEV